MSDVGFGSDLVEETAFGADIPPPTGEGEPNVVLLIQQLHQEIEALAVDSAGTMDEIRIQKNRNQKGILENRITELNKLIPQANTRPEEVWTDLALAYAKFGKKHKDTVKNTVATTGLNDRTYSFLTQQLSQMHQDKEATKAKAKDAKKDAKNVPPTAQERFQGVLTHAKNLGFDGQVVFDELGLSTVDDASVDKLLAVVNERGSNLATDTVQAVPVSTEAFGADVTGTENYFSDANFEGLINPDTGEVVERSWFLNRLGWANWPTKPNAAQADQILDLIKTAYLDPARRYLEQAEKRAAPLLARAAQLEKVFGTFLDKSAEAPGGLPRVKSGDNTGKFSAKTWHLPSGDISYTKGGGTCEVESGKFYFWLSEQKGKLMALRDSEDETALEEMKQLEALYGLKLKTDVDFSKDKIKAIADPKQLPPGWQALPVNELHKRTIK